MSKERELIQRAQQLALEASYIIGDAKPEFTKLCADLDEYLSKPEQEQSKKHTELMMSAKCKAFSKSKLGLEPVDNRQAFYAGWDAAIASIEFNFCPRCGKRTSQKDWVHTCTPPLQEK